MRWFVALLALWCAIAGPASVAQINAGIDLHSALSALITVKTKDAVIKYVPHAKVNADDEGLIHLQSGEIFVGAKRNTKVEAGKYSVEIEPNTAVLISREIDSVSVRNLYERNANSVKVTLPSSFTTVSAGEELLVSPSYKDVSRLLRSEPLDLRHIRNIDQPDGTSIMRADVSLISLAANSRVLTAIKKSKEGQDKNIMEQVLKMAAVLSQTTGHRGAYSSIR